ncbi:MAG: pyridoxamine 5'-phosphate oxidase [Bacteroidia bacterium]
MTSQEIAAIRESYSKASLSEQDINKDPIEQFRNWFSEAVDAEVIEPNAMALGTVGKSGQPAVRIVLLKGVEKRGFVFFTNYQSHKGQEMESNPHVALTFFWPELERQVRIKGLVEKVPASESDEYFHSRPRDSRIGAWASPQSKAIDSREVIEKNVQELMGQFGEEGEVPRPLHWGGYLVRPHEIEFWQGRPSRLHDRICFYKQEDRSWKIVRLAP